MLGVGTAGAVVVAGVCGYHGTGASTNARALPSAFFGSKQMTIWCATGEPMSDMSVAALRIPQKLEDNLHGLMDHRIHDMARTPCAPMSETRFSVRRWSLNSSET